MELNSPHSLGDGKMPTRYAALYLAPLLMAVTVPSVEAQGVIAGIVREDSSGTPLPGIEVLLEGANRRVTTNEAGRYRLENVAAGGSTLLFRGIGYQPVRIPFRRSQEDTIWVNALLSASAQQPAPVVVQESVKGPSGAGLEGFEERRRMGFGTFIDGPILRKEENRRLFEVLRRHSAISLGGTGVSKADPGGPVYAVSTRVHNLLGEPCFMQVIVDGVPMVGSPAPDLKRDFEVSELEAVEIYKGGAATPMEFGGTRALCGTIVLWTRRGVSP